MMPVRLFCCLFNLLNTSASLKLERVAKEGTSWFGLGNSASRRESHKGARGMLEAVEVGGLVNKEARQVLTEQQEWKDDVSEINANPMCMKERQLQ